MKIRVSLRGTKYDGNELANLHMDIVSLLEKNVMLCGINIKNVERIFWGPDLNEDDLKKISTLASGVRASIIPD